MTTLQSFTQTEVRDYTDFMAEQLDDVDARVEMLEEHARELTGTARAEFDETVADLLAQRDAIQDRLEGLKASSREAWLALRSGLDRSWSVLDDAVDSAIEEFGGDTADD